MPSEIRWAIAIAVGAALILVGWKLPFLLTTVHVLACFLLIVVVLLQSGKAADLAGAFGGAGSQTAFGPRGAATILSQATTWCAIMFMVCAMALVLRVDRAVNTGGSAIYNTTKPAATKPVTPAPVTPAPAPATTPAPNSSAPATQQPQQQAPAPAPQTPKK